MMRLNPNIHRSHRDPDYTTVPPVVSKGKDLAKLVDYYTNYSKNSNLFSNLTLTTHTRAVMPPLRPKAESSKDFARKTQLMRQHNARDTFGHIYGIKDPSNLAQPASVNDKYDCTVFDNKDVDTEKENRMRQSYFYEELKDPIKANTQPKVKPFIREMIVRSELDHEYSLHNQLINTIQNRITAKVYENPLETQDAFRSIPYYTSKKKIFEGIRGIMY